MLHGEASVLRLYPYGEHGLIVVLSTEEHGVIRALARQARKAGSDFFGLIDLFYECEIHGTRAKKGDLHTLKSVQLLRPRLELRKQLLKLRLASYMSRLIEATVESHENEPVWHQLISAALDYLAREPAASSILLHFEKRLATLHGLYRSDRCAHQSLLHHFDHLPAGREDLLRDLSMRSRDEG